MNRIYVRPARPGEAQQYFEWAEANKDKNGFDPEVARYPSSTTWAAYDADGPVGYQTLQRPVILESFAPRPELSKQQAALALKELAQNAITQAHVAGAGEVLYLGTDEGTDQMATNQTEFELLPYRVYRLRLRSLEEAK